MRVTPVEAASYAGSAVSMGAGLSLDKAAVVVGIVTAILTMVINAIYVYRKDRREERESIARLHELEEKQHGE
nr:HP1 family phage holin [Burkholderia gladioli]